MAYNRYVVYGRLAKVDGKGVHHNELVTIVDVLNIYSLLVQNEKSERYVIPVKALILTSFVDEHTSPLNKEEASEITKKLVAEYKQSPEGIKEANAEKRANLRDFERFMAQKLMKERNQKINTLMH